MAAPDYICPHCGSERMLTPGRMMTCTQGCESLIRPTDAAMKYIRSIDLRKDYPVATKLAKGFYMIDDCRYVISKRTTVQEHHANFEQIGEILAIVEGKKTFQLRCFTPSPERKNVYL